MRVRLAPGLPRWLWYNKHMQVDFEGQRSTEKVICVFRRHILTSFRGFLFLLFMSIAGFLPILMWPDNQKMVFVWMIAVVIGLIGMGYSYILWYFSFYLLTNERLRQTRQKSLFKKTVVDLDLTKILSVSFGVPGMWGSIFGYGTILVQTSAGDLVLSTVKNPEEIHNQLQNAIHEANKEANKV